MNKIVTFTVGNELYAFNIDSVVEIVTIKKESIRGLPELPEGVVGITDFRGHVLPLVDLRKLFFGDGKLTGKNTVLVTSQSGSFVGFVVDSVDKVRDVDGEEEFVDRKDVPVEMSDCVTGVLKLDGRLCSLLDPAEITSSLKKGGGDQCLG